MAKYTLFKSGASRNYSLQRNIRMISFHDKHILSNPLKKEFWYIIAVISLGEDQEAFENQGGPKDTRVQVFMITSASLHVMQEQ